MATYLNYPFDPELFLLNWQQETDPVKTALYESGAVQDNALIRSLIANGGDFYSVPFYTALGGNVQNYDGATNITANSVSGKEQTGIVFGRMAAWAEKQFVRDYSAADPMKQITTQTAKYWQKQRQAILLKILAGIFGVSATGWNDHTTNLAIQAAGTVGDANKVTATTAAEAIQKAVGDNAGIFSVAVMHSAIALALAKKDTLTFRTYNDANGMQRQMNIADWNGLTVIVDDGVPAATNSAVSTAVDYTTYLLGAGAIQHADGPVTEPVEVYREPLTAGGQNTLITRVRETIHPNGFSFTKPASGYAGSPTDAQLAAAANWSVVGDPKNIAIARIISNG